MTVPVQGSRLKRIVVVVVVVLVAAAVVTVALVARTSAQASGVRDDASEGSIVLRDRSGHVITHGDVHDHPFVWTATSSVPAPDGYRGSGAKATLLAFQPRQGVGPSAWSGDTLTASTVYTDPDHPAASATEKDFSLQDFLDEFPPRWDGRIELRLYLSAPGQPARNSGYPAVMLRISGSQWSVVTR
jgi:hypothetical protein